MVLTPENYYTLEANQHYWSASLVKEFISCEARALASIQGEYTRPTTSALLIGGYVDAYIEGPNAFQAFCDNHPEIFKRDGSLKMDYVKADDMIARINMSPVFMDFLTGERQVIKTGEIFGLPFKAKFDIYQEGKRIVDLKTVRDLKPVYVPGEGRLAYYDAWNWPLQMAIYQAVEGNHLPCYLAVVTKEDPPDIDLIEVPQWRLDAELEFLKNKLPYFDAVKEGVIEPKRCEDCAYCRSTKEITEPRTIERMDMEVAE